MVNQCRQDAILPRANILWMTGCSTAAAAASATATGIAVVRHKHRWRIIRVKRSVNDHGVDRTRRNRQPQYVIASYFRALIEGYHCEVNCGIFSSGHRNPVLTFVETG